MYRDPIQWAKIRSRIQRKEISIRGMCRETGISRNTVKKMLAHRSPPIRKKRNFPFPVLAPHIVMINRLLAENDSLPPRTRLSIKAIHAKLQAESGFSVGYSTLKDFIGKNRPVPDCVWTYAYDMLTTLDRAHAIDFLFMLSRSEPLVLSELKLAQVMRHVRQTIPQTNAPSSKEKRWNEQYRWLFSLLQNAVPLDLLEKQIGLFEARDELLQLVWGGRLSTRNKAITVLAAKAGITAVVACEALYISKKTQIKYCRAFQFGGVEALLARKPLMTRKTDDAQLKDAIFTLLHEPPKLSGVNRTSWKMADFKLALANRGFPACPDVIRTITKAAGYRWRKARTVLTSSDPDYRVKLDSIQSILSSLKPSEAFFSIDEFGPFAVKAKGGRSLTPPGVKKTVPQWQKSKGCLILTAALELSGNQVEYFYSEKKNTSEMIKMMRVLLDSYKDRTRIFLSWDAASWHVSKRLTKEISAHNETATARGSPTVQTAPLPAGAQFLNVIESVFSGMARAIIHNSDYASVDDAKRAIATYFSERNSQFKKVPRRAGKKIWGQERVRPAFEVGNNCKDPRYR